MKTPIVTIVGRPNTGKSTLFNRLAGERIAITSEVAGTTRDRLFHKVDHSAMDFFLVDTGGLEFGKTALPIEDDMRLQAQVAIDEADLILFVVEGRTEVTRKDTQVAELLRKAASKKSVFLIANKCDEPLPEDVLAPLYQLGLGDPIQVSGLNKVGTDALMAKIITQLKSQHFLTKGSEAYKAAARQEQSNLNIALVGRPNVGKSSLINALLREDKLIVSDVPGTTRDSTDSLVRHKGKVYNFIDTAGLRRRGKIEEGIEYFSSLRSMASIERSDVALLVLDSSEAISHQDQQVAHYVLEAHKGLILLINKWDLSKTSKLFEDIETEEKRQETFLRRLQRRFPFTPWAPAIFTSAVTKKNLDRIFDQVEVVKAERNKRISTGQLNTFVQQLITQHRPSGTKAVAPKIFYMTQSGTNPPEFVLFVNKKKYFHFSYLRHLENRLREKFGFIGTAIKLSFREKESRYGKKKK